MMKKGCRYLLLILLFLLAGCQSPEAEPLPPNEYLENALNWLEANALKAADLAWDTVRQEALAQAPHPETTVDTYPAIVHALAQLQDQLAFLWLPDQVVGDLGILAVYPENIVVEVEENSPSAAAGVRPGDVIEAIDGQPPGPQKVSGAERQLVSFIDLYAEAPPSIELQLRRGDEAVAISVKPAEFDHDRRPTSRQIQSNGSTIGYLDLPTDNGTEMFPTWTQEAMAAVENRDTCGWIIDLRRNVGGDLWTYLASLGPLLGEGEVGGFAYQDGSQEKWYYRDGKVFWEDEERFESYVRGPILELSRPAAPVALLIGPITEAAGELTVVAFQGREQVRTFGAPTAGAPRLVLNTPLSDGAILLASGAYGMDRTGHVYQGSIQPDETVEIDWRLLGQDLDPVIQAAADWLAGQPECS